MRVQLRIDRIRTIGADERKLRAVLKRLPPLLEQRFQDRRFAAAQLPSLSAVAASDDAGDLAAALADALARGLP